MFSFNQLFEDDIRTGNVNGVREHIKCGLDVNARDKYGTTYLNTACKYNRLEIVQILIEAGAKVRGCGALLDPSWKGNSKIVKELIKNGADVNEKYLYNLTPLIYACHGRSLETVKALIDAGASVIHRDDQGHNAIDYARDTKNLGIINAINGALHQ